MRLRFVVAAGACLAVAACATAAVVAPDGGAEDASTSDASTSDASTSDGTTNDGACASPNTKCADDAGYVCTDTKTDTNHCGAVHDGVHHGRRRLARARPEQPRRRHPVRRRHGLDPRHGRLRRGTCAVVCPRRHDRVRRRHLLRHPELPRPLRRPARRHAPPAPSGATADIAARSASSIATARASSALTDKNNCGGCGVTCSGGTPYCDRRRLHRGVLAVRARARRSTRSRRRRRPAAGRETRARKARTRGRRRTASPSSTRTRQVVCSGTTACVVARRHHDLRALVELPGLVGRLLRHDEGRHDRHDEQRVPRRRDDERLQRLVQRRMTCSSIKFVGTTGSVGACCGSTGLHSMITAVSAW